MKPLRDPLGRPIPRLYFKTEEAGWRANISRLSNSLL